MARGLPQRRRARQRKRRSIIRIVRAASTRQPRPLQRQLLDVRAGMEARSSHSDQVLASHTAAAIRPDSRSRRYEKNRELSVKVQKPPPLICVTPHRSSRCRARS